jgi:2-polyprenyl-3-methyl-5-hydroxy-6-metoxy-1,4-benzoquinol methylase
LNSEYTRNYFSDHAAAWLATAYGLDEFPLKYPTGLNRVRITLGILAQHFGDTQGRLVDLGCGGGELCLAAAGMGLTATGLDIAEGMIANAEQARLAAPVEVQSRVRFVQGDLLSSSLETAAYGAVSALGVIEYLKDDAAFFGEAYRLLEPGGVFILSCRNRLFNITSLNDYTEKEIQQGAIGILVKEAASTIDLLPIDAMRGFLSALSQRLPMLEQALDLDVNSASPPPPKAKFSAERRQHSPDELWASARKAGFQEAKFTGVHPHPFAPKLKFVAPRFYNQFARVYESLENYPISLSWSSAFIGAFTKPK